MFLENPMKARTRRMLHTYDDRDDPGAAFVEDEPFLLDKDAVREHNAMWIRDYVLSGDCGLANANYKVRLSRLHAMSVGPAEPFLGSYSSSMLALFEKLAGKVPPEFLARGLVADVVTGLDNWKGRDPGYKFPSGFIYMPDKTGKSAGYEVELCGGVDFVAPATESSPVAFVAVRDSGASPAQFSKSSFQPLLFGLMTAAYGAENSLEMFDVIEISKKSFLTYRFNIDRSAAREYIEALIRDYLDDSRLLELLPYLAVEAVFAGENLDSVEPPFNIGSLTASLIESIEEKATDAPGGYYPSEAELLLADRASVPSDLWQTIVRRYRVPWGHAGPDKGRASRKRGGH